MAGTGNAGTKNGPGHVRAVWWEETGEQIGERAGMAEAAVCLIDQSQLPLRVTYLRLAHERAVAEAIETLKVRGAPAIGIAAAFGMALAAHRFTREHPHTPPMETIQEHLLTVAHMLARTRPTAVNLFWALERMERCLKRAVEEQVSVSQLVARLKNEAQAIADEDEAACAMMGSYGAELIADGDILLTHCNAGALATAGLGTALAPIYVAHRAGKRVHVFVDETRPVLQGARLTAWELQQQGVPLTLITDNMAAHFMRHGGIKAVFVGADRITANGDVANKIGTYGLAVLAQAHRIPFYVVAPCSTIDLKLASGECIPLEQRRAEEVTTIRGVRIAPEGITVANPAFDVTPHIYVTAIITERGIAWPPYERTLCQLCTQQEQDFSRKRESEVTNDGC